jgi:leucyl-tRNA synthetase
MSKYLTTAQIARELRKNQTPSEKVLWALLRNRKLDGHKFLRQHPIIYDYNSTPQKFIVADFFCAEKRLIVELDGGIHKTQRNKDRVRDVTMNNKGYRVIRIRNEELINTKDVLDKIRKEL